MPFDILHIILAGVLLVFVAGIIILLYVLKNKNKQANKRIKRISNKFAEEKKYFEKEITRQNFLLNEYKQKNGSKRSSIEQSELVSQTVEINENSSSASPQLIDTRPTHDPEFKDKNKKLWELSIAVHKEKERINKMRKEIQHRHDEVTKSITYAQRIQKALLPSSKILGVRFNDYFILWKPRDIVSGDFYWVKRLENSTIVVIADCTGHGVPGAFMSLLGISFLNDILTKDKTLKSYEILDKLREMIKLALQQDEAKRKASDGMDMGICIINHKTLEIDFSGANNPMYLIRNGEIYIYKENRNPVGRHHAEKPFKNHEFTLKKNDRIYMFSDGYIDQFGGKTGRKFLKRNFQRLLLHLSQQDLPMQMESKLLEEVLNDWRGEQHPQIDDVLILGIKI